MCLHLSRDVNTFKFLRCKARHYIDIRHVAEDNRLVGIMGIVMNCVEPLNINDPTMLFHSLCHMSYIENLSSELRACPDVIFRIYVDRDQGGRILDALSKRIGLLSSPFDLFKAGTTMHRIRWQLKQLNPEIAKCIRDVAYERYVGMIDEFQEAIKDWYQVKEEVIKNRNISRYTGCLNKIGIPMIRLQALFLDVYLVCRIFRMLEQQNSQVCIAYVGAIHKESIDRMLQSINTVSKVSDVNNLPFDASCSDYDNRASIIGSLRRISQDIHHPGIVKIFNEDLFNY